MAIESKISKLKQKTARKDEERREREERDFEKDFLWKQDVDGLGDNDPVSKFFNS